MKKVRPQSEAGPVDVKPDQSKSTSIRETFRRHRVLFSLPMVLGLLAAGFVLFHTTTTYRSTTNLWVDTAPPTASSVGANAVPLPTTPAAAEQSVLSELLNTRSFAVSVARESLLGKYLGSPAAIELHAPSLLTSSQVGSLAAGPQLLQISYTATSPAVASSTLGAIVKELQQDSAGLSTQHNQDAIAYYKSQVAVGTKAVATARGQVDAYLAQHPHSTSQSDPNLSALIAAVNAASTQLAQSNTALSQASGTRAGGGWLVQVVDSPSAAVANALGKKKMLEVLLGGIFGGALISFLGAMALTPAKKKEPWEDEFAADSPAPSYPARDSFAGGLMGESRARSRARSAASELEDERHFVFGGAPGDLDRQ
jgi:uncharacterized protein involved in exopolysaccharide biosynthesis